MKTNRSNEKTYQIQPKSPGDEMKQKREMPAVRGIHWAKPDPQKIDEDDIENYNISPDETGNVFGLLGSNGGGKTSLFKVLSLL